MQRFPVPDTLTAYAVLPTIDAIRPVNEESIREGTVTSPAHVLSAHMRSEMVEELR
jgi:hypothetical protein